MRTALFALLALTLLTTRLDARQPSSSELELRRGDRICYLGNALAERMQHHGWLEARLQSRFPLLELSFRNLGFSADELTVQQRTQGFGSWDDYLTRCEADVIFAFFGFNESFSPKGPSAFGDDLRRFIDHARGQRYNGREAPRLVLFSCIPHEDVGSPSLPDGREENRRIQAINDVIAQVAREKDVPFVDIFEPMLQRYDSERAALTINGIHLTEHGNEVLAALIEVQLFGHGAEPEGVDRLRKVILEKNLLWFNRYRATDGYNVYGGRSSLKFIDDVTNFQVLQREMKHLDALAKNRDRRIWAIARGEDLEVDDANAPPLLRVKTNKPGDSPDGKHEYLDGEAAIEQMSVASGMKINLFADEKQFPELVNPVQMAWDTRGRLWVAAWPTYPHWEPGKPINDKLLILEDVDQDGRADTCKVFADDLHNPTGFELWNGGVIVANAPDLLFLRDTDGDDRADSVERILHGLSSADTHHSANSFVLGPGGELYFQEGTFHQSQIETIYGPERNHNGCVWRFEPRTFRTERYIAYNFANPHGHVFDRWGQDFVTDGTGNVNYYALPFSTRVVHPDKHRGYFPFFKQRSRPCAGTEILSSSHFPEENQGNYLVCNVIGFQGIFQYRVLDDGSGFSAEEAEPIVYSSDPRFRPSDAEVGPEGALYFLDWYNPLIGHMQHHLRDPSRDHEHGRVYRVTYPGRPLTTPAAIAGEPIPVLLELLKSPDDRVRYRTRIELSARPTPAVIAAARAWVSGLDPGDDDHEHHLLEGLWVHQQHDVMDEGLLRRVLASKDARARAAATRVLRHARHRIQEPLALLAPMARDEHPRVRLAAIAAASSFDSAEAALIALSTKERPTDRFLDYALSETMRTLEPFWKAAIREGRLAKLESSAGLRFLLERVSEEELTRLPRTPAVLDALLTRHDIAREARLDAAEALARSRGTTPALEILKAVRRLDREGGPHARHVLHELGSLVRDRASSTPLPEPVLVELATSGHVIETRQLAYATLISQQGAIEGVYRLSQRSRTDLVAFLGAIPMLGSAELRRSTYERVRPLMFHVPDRFRVSGRDEAESVAGVHVAYYPTRLRTARMPAFEKLTPQVSARVGGFSLNVPGVPRRSDAFGLLFQGTLHVPKGGTYTFSTHSDDGSLLYLDGKLVVDNDGDHGLKRQSSSLPLSAGPHAITVTYFDQGGAEGLEVEWEGPDIPRGPIPTAALSVVDADTIRAAAIRAMAHIPGDAREKLQDAAELIGEGALIEPALDLVERVDRGEWPLEQIDTLIASIAAYATRLPAEQRTAPHVVAALEAGKRIAGALPDDRARAARESLTSLSGTTILIRTLPHQMLYDRKELFVEAGKPVAIVFQNNDVMPHNLVVTAPGQMEKVGILAESLPVSPTGPPQSFVPKIEDVLFHTELLFPGESTTLRFVAPSATGDYPYVCTFPGHWRVMNGVLHVVEKVDASMLAAAPAKAESAPARRFVKMWTLADLAPAFTPDWKKGRSTERGRAMFSEAGCNKCHGFLEEKVQDAPDLTEITKKFQGKDLLKEILEPSANILESYTSHLFVMEDETIVVGRVVGDDGTSLRIVPNLLAPEDIVTIRKSEIAEQEPSLLSPMPTGLLVTLSREEILDLIAYLESASTAREKSGD